MDFGFQFISKSVLFLSDPSFGASLLTVEPSWKVTEKVHTVIPGQVAVCWTQYDPELKTLYAIDAGRNIIYTLDAGSGAITGKSKRSTRAERLRQVCSTARSEMA